jgi:hypothetical protein
MVRSQTFPFSDYALATSGQIAWVYLNQLIDHDERVRKIHVHCLPKFNRETCEVCGEAVIDISELDPETRDLVYKPSENERYNVNVDLANYTEEVEDVEIEL